MKESENTLKTIFSVFYKRGLIILAIVIFAITMVGVLQALSLDYIYADVNLNVGELSIELQENAPFDDLSSISETGADTDTKVFRANLAGDISGYVRARITPVVEYYDATDGWVVINIDINNVVLNVTATDWVYSDGYYYYKYILNKNEITTDVTVKIAEVKNLGMYVDEDLRITIKIGLEAAQTINDLWKTIFNINNYPQTNTSIPTGTTSEPIQTYTKVTVTGNNVVGRETIVELKNETTGRVYNGILGNNGQVIFKNIDYGTYKITCKNPLDIQSIGYTIGGISTDTFTLTQNGTTEVVKDIILTNELKSVSGFYDTEENNNRMKYTVLTSPTIALAENASELAVQTSSTVNSVIENVPIPTGFYYVGGTRDTGIVISDDAVDENRYNGLVDVGSDLVGNQFVWVPAIARTTIVVNITHGKKGEQIRKYAQGNQDIAYFATNGTEFTGDEIYVMDGGIYTVYTKSNNGLETVKTITINLKSMYNGTIDGGQLYDFSSGRVSTKRTYDLVYWGFRGKYGNSFREPDKVAGESDGKIYDGVLSNLIAAGLDTLSYTEDGWQATWIMESELQQNLAAMLESVKKYNGFYIGRYETGDLYDGNVSKVVVKQGNYSISNSSWYYIYKKEKELYKTSTSVVSTMIFGSAWDATLIWINQNLSNGDYAVDSETRGNYPITEVWNTIATGENEDYKVNNIYDMAGNIGEWTIEANGSTERTIRGGNAWWYTPVGARGSAVPIGENANGSRVQLYIK